MKKPVPYSEWELKMQNNPVIKTLQIQSREKSETLLARIKANLPTLRALLSKVTDHFGYEDHIYRYYHRSYKVFAMQDLTDEIVKALQEINPEGKLNPLFTEIIQSGTGFSFKQENNQNWSEVTRPIVEAFLHCKYFLEMIIKYGEELGELPNPMPSGWAAVLSLYCLR